MKTDARSQILKHLDTHGVVDKDAAAPASERSRNKAFARSKAGPRRRLDLHGLSEDAAAPQLTSCIEQCRRDGVKELLVIHGYGLHTQPSDTPVLKTMVRQMLEGSLKGLVRGYRPAGSKDGGKGATVVRVS